MLMMRPLDPIKQEKIIRAVFILAGKHGLAGIHMNGISKEAGVGIGSLYTYFNSKEEVIQAAYASVENKLTQRLYEQFDIHLPVHDSLKKVFFNALKYRLRHYDETVFIDQYIQSNYVQLNFAKQLHEFERENQPLFDLLQKGQGEDIVIKYERFIMISFINSAVRSLSNGIIQKLIPLKKQVIEDSFNMLWKGVSSERKP